MSIKKNILPFLVISILGSLLHFIYDWTNENFIVGLFSAVNESTWEHLKLLFFPSVLYSVAEYFIGKKQSIKNFFPAVLWGVLSGMFAIVVIFYTYSGILGFNVDFLNITIFLIAVIVFLRAKSKLIKSELFTKKNATVISIIFLIIIALLFFVWTYNPPSLGIFTPPVI